MDKFELSVATRTTAGKGASRRLRRQNLVPAIVYGGEGDPESIQIDKFELDNHLKYEAFYSHVLTLNFGDRRDEVVLKDVQRHPIKPEVAHVDFMRITKGEALTMQVPLHFMNEEDCKGVKAGGILNKLLNELEVTCLPKDLPEYIEVDVEGLDIGDAVHLGELKLPAGVTIAALEHDGDATLSVVSVNAPTVSEAELEADEAEAEAASAAAAAEAPEAESSKDEDEAS